MTTPSELRGLSEALDKARPGSSEFDIAEHAFIAACVNEIRRQLSEGDGRQVLPEGWRLSVGRGVVPEIIFISIDGPSCTMGIQCGDRDVNQRIAEQLEAALSAQHQGERSE